MGLKFTNQRVADPASQQNFEQLEGLFPLAAALIGNAQATGQKTKLDVVKAGPVTGTGGALAVDPTYSTLWSMNYTTPADQRMQGVILWHMVAQSTAAAWNYMIGRCRVSSGAALAQVGTRGPAAWLNTAGPLTGWLHGFTYVQLEKNTAYTFSLEAACNGNVAWAGFADNFSLGLFWAL